MLLLQCFTLRKFYMMRVKARIITSDRRCTRHARDQIVECWLHTCQACPIETWRLGLRAPLFARNKFNHFITSYSPKKKKTQVRDRVLMRTHAIYLSDDPSAHILTKHTKNYVFHFIRWKRSTQTEKETIYQRYFLVTHTRRDTGIVGHFRVPETLTLTTRQSAKSFLLKWVIFA